MDPVENGYCEIRFLQKLKSQFWTYPDPSRDASASLTMVPTPPGIASIGGSCPSEVQEVHNRPYPNEYCRFRAFNALPSLSSSEIPRNCERPREKSEPEGQGAHWRSYVAEQTRRSA